MTRDTTIWAAMAQQKYRHLTIFVLNKLDDKQTSIKEKTNTKKLRQIQLAALAKLKQGNQKKKQDNRKNGRFQ